MIAELLKPEVQKFIASHENDVPAQLMLQASKFPHLPMRLIVEQIQSKKKAKLKIPDWHKTNNIIYPPTLSLEQCSSEATALYKQSLVSGGAMTDLTGGMGIDSFYLSKVFDHVNYVERQQDLAEIADHNFGVLRVRNIQVHNQTAEAFLEDSHKEFDTIFLDPARRDLADRKVFRLADCEPNLMDLLPKIGSCTEKILIKAAPLLDIKSAIAELGGVSEVHIVAVKGEVKELLFLIEKDRISHDPLIVCTDLKREVKWVFTFKFSEETDSLPEYGRTKRYLYEPNAAILKGGAFKSFASQNKLQKLHPNTHLYTSDRASDKFQGRVFEVQERISLNKKALRKQIPDLKANISVRNFPLKVEQIRKKTGLKEGGDRYIFATRDMEGAQVFLCSKSF